MDFNMLAAGADILGGLAQTGYNIYTNYRDFDYQKSLQQQIFNREDNAVQRRMNDLAAAGLNPNLAAGSAASAGQIVSRSSTNDINVGSTLDTIAAINQIRLQKQETENAKLQNKILSTQSEQLKFNKNVDLYSTLSSLGFDVTPKLYSDKNGLGLDIGFDYVPNMIFDASSGKTYLPDTKKYRDMVVGSLNDTYDLLNIQRNLAQKDYDWYTADKVSGMIFNALGLNPLKFSYKIK